MYYIKDMEDEKEFLRSHDIKPSIQRIMVLRFLRDNPVHPTAEEVYQGLINGLPTLSRTTIYNTLNFFARKGLVKILNLGHNETRFDLNTDRHHHFKCMKCGRIYDIYIGCSLPDKGEVIDGHIVIEQEVVLMGVCRICKTKQGGEGEV